MAKIKSRNKKVGRGKLIVIEGIDGSGKSVQTRLLIDRLKKEGYKVAIEDFPQYGKKSAGLVEEYLNGTFGTARELGPYIPSVFYAADRFAAKKRIAENLANGKIIVSNRYATTNMGHQGGKIGDKKTREIFFTWDAKLEYGFFGIPRPDLTIILYVPPSTAQKLVDKKGHRMYIAGKKRDIHEDDITHLQNAADTYVQMSKKFKLPLIQCVRNGKLLAPKEISDLIWQKVSRIL